MFLYLIIMINFYEEILVFADFYTLTKGFVIVLNRCVIHIYAITVQCTCIYIIHIVYTQVQFWF